MALDVVWANENAVQPRINTDSHGRGRAFPNFCATTLQNLRVPRGYCRCRVGGRGLRNCCQRFALRPGGTPQEISRGHARAAGAAPGCTVERAMPQRGIEEFALAASSARHFRHHRLRRAVFFDAPLGHGAKRRGFRGRRPLARTCPPANLLRRPSGTGSGRARMPRGFFLKRGRSPPAAARYPGSRRKIPATLLRCCRCDRGPVALRFGCGSAALFSSDTFGMHRRRVAHPPLSRLERTAEVGQRLK